MATFFKGMQIIPGTGEVIPNGSLLVEEGMIKDIGEEGKVPIPEGAQVIELTRKTLLPGFIDAHVHIMADASPDPLNRLKNESPVLSTVKAINHLRKTLMAGITTIRDLGGRDYIELELRRCIEEGLLIGPRILGAGKVITMTGGHAHMIGREADGVDDVRKAAREQLKAGADVVKLMATGGILTPGVEPGASQLTLQEMQSAIEEAHKAGKKTATHAQGSEGILDAILAGIDSVEHGIFLNEEIIRLMERNQVFLVPTLSAPYWIVEAGIKGGIPSFIVRKAEKIKKTHEESFRMAVEAKIKIAMGTDAGTPFNEHGRNVQEIIRMVEVGMDPMEAITCATRGGAELLGILEERGTLEVGKMADMIVVNGDPLTNMEVLFEVEEVFQDGVPYKRELGEIGL